MGQVNAERLRALLRGRRQFDVMGLTRSEIATDPALAGVKRFYDKYPHANGIYLRNSRVPPETPLRGDGLDRATATYLVDNPELARYTRRHEVMHGIHHAAKFDPEVERAIPWWARGRSDSGFAGELLARLASREPNALIGWDMMDYANRTKDAAYRVAIPVQSAARFMATPAGAVVAGGALGTAVAVPVLAGLYDAAPGGEPEEPPQEYVPQEYAPTPSPVHGVRVLSRMATGGY